MSYQYHTTIRYGSAPISEPGSISSERSELVGAVCEIVGGAAPANMWRASAADLRSGEG